ncbi:MAG: type II toxin-antitoxin system RelE/ParE family toxin [Pseudolabrys sp.]
MKLRYTAQARDHIAGIFIYLNDRNAVAATPVVARIRLAAERLAEFPRIGHAGRVPGTYEWLVRGLPYIVVYDFSSRGQDEVLILGVFHGAQDRERE